MNISSALKEGIAVVTGASSGLGRAMALTLAKQGVHVAALARSHDVLEALAQESPEGRISPYAVDIGDVAAVAETFGKIRQQGHCTVLINNAAVYPHRDILDETPESFMGTVQINLGGMVACSHEALKDMVELGYGRIVNVTTYAGDGPIPLAAAYSVSKGATRILTLAQQADLSDRFPDILINEWIPGALNTGMGIPDGIPPEQAAAWGGRLALWHDRALIGLTFALDRSIVPPRGWKRRLLSRLLLQRNKIYYLGSPE